MTWFYEEGGQRKGPVAVQDLATMLRSGQLGQKSLVWREGLENWQSASAMMGEIMAAAPSPAVAIVDGILTRYCSNCGQAYAESMLAPIGGGSVCVNCKPIVLQRMRQGEARPGSMEYGGVGVRLVAVMIDGVAMWIVGAVVTIVIGAAGDSGAAAGLAALVNLAIGVSYEAGMIATRGATFGKMAMGLKVVRADGAPVDWGPAVGRYFAKFLSAFILGIGYLMALWDAEKRTLHDRLCETRVIRVR